VAGATEVPDTITLIKVGDFVVPVTAAGEPIRRESGAAAI
jgi:adenylate cyclase